RHVRDQAERRSRPLEDRSLLDVDLEEERRVLVSGGEGRAADAAALLVAEGDDGAPPGTLDRLDACNDAQSTVELAALGHRVEVRADQDGGVARPTEEVPGRVDLDREPSLLHPTRRELVCAVLAGASARPVGARPTA